MGVQDATAPFFWFIAYGGLMRVLSEPQNGGCKRRGIEPEAVTHKDNLLSSAT